MESLTDEQRALFADGGQLDDYEVLKPIGKGKFSVVFKAKRRHDGQAVALKKIAIFDMMNLKAREKTLKEVRLVQSVSHPNIIQYLDAFVQNNELYIAFEWAEAGDLKRQIRKANEKGNRIMHRDLKPANIFLTLKGVVKVGDLGLGRYLSENTMEARSKVGTPLYMSPEVLRGESYDWKSDVWSLGCILYELAMLRSPFKSEAAQKILLAAEKAGVFAVAQLSAPTLTSGVGVEACELLDALTAAVVSDDDGQQNQSIGESTASLALEDDDAFSRWVVVKEENPYPTMTDNDRENAMIHTDIDPVAWELERRHQVQTQGGLIVAAQKDVQHEIAQIQATRQEQAEQSQRYEKQLNKRFLRARRLYDESTTRLAKSQDEMQTAQERVNRATVEVVRLQAARSELADAVKAADARITDNSRLLERKRQVQHLIDENRELGMRLQVLHDYWTRKQQHAIQYFLQEHLMAPRTPTPAQNSYDYQANAESDCEYDDTGLGLALLEQVEPFLTFERIQFNAVARLATFQFHFCGGRRFQATMSLTGPLQDLDETPVVRNALLHIGLCILPWFWMGYSCKYIRIEAGYLNSEQVHFWEEFYQSVLSEYLYLHGLDRDRLHIIVDAPASEALPVLADRKLEQGGGKDSLEFERSWRFKEIVEMTGASAFRFEHNMEDKTWETILGDFTHVAVGNERSANYDNNVVHEGRPVNHQYDKSFDFETRAHAYIRKYLVEDLHYFLALQHLWEVQIARTFASRSLESSENFLPVFLSCNEAPDGDKWCCKCAKCAFVFILMSAWCSEAQLVEIFGENLFEKQSVFPEFLSLLDEEGVKPMECVGTACETWLSLYLALQAHGDSTFLKSHDQAIRLKGGTMMHLLDDYNSEHLLPEFLEPTLRQPVMMLGA
ncbi:hypothetical protein JG688_00000673 [Phytophthora aleatoria]|uniref:non-specific serine/threonine protein kinase n=1 Tax=Phytophthora aleatoria TaxID=2496075 RepID=A0A8J5J7K1_9STRA|nr:hypothetical protein JG688_00000673 [Phytophthora aleatoria]